VHRPIIFEMCLWVYSCHVLGFDAIFSPDARVRILLVGLLKSIPIQMFLVFANGQVMHTSMQYVSFALGV